jgi:hypothetical protein
MDVTKSPEYVMQALLVVMAAVVDMALLVVIMVVMVDMVLLAAMVLVHLVIGVLTANSNVLILAIMDVTNTLEYVIQALLAATAAMLDTVVLLVDMALLVVITAALVDMVALRVDMALLVATAAMVVMAELAVMAELVIWTKRKHGVLHSRKRF